jgi:carotenoid 1,2-hydratase
VRILFGPENDHCHTPFPASSGSYEWWYFDALSTDGRYALVAIFFLGSPMTPYYKATADGKSPNPLDWCGVFFTLHEKADGKWKERAYAYNLYRAGEFRKDRPEVSIGDSRMTCDGAGIWTVFLKERGLWKSEIQAELRFILPSIPAIVVSAGGQANDGTHAWVCVAPVCAMTAQIRLGTRTVSFEGEGYHDHNFGTLPLREVAAWYWARSTLLCSDGVSRTAILYYLLSNQSSDAETVMLMFDAEGNNIPCSESIVGYHLSPQTNAYGLTHASIVKADSRQGEQITMTFTPKEGTLSEGPFYRRLPVEMTARFGTEWTGKGNGIGEIFVPSRLCGPIASRAMWSRIRRRSRP